MENMLGSSQPTKGEKYKKLIVAVSIIIPVAVAALFKVKIPGYDLSFLPPIYAGINAATAILLVVGFVAIKNKNQAIHETVMKICIGLSICFLVMYVAYHITSETTHYGGQGAIRTIYFVLLITHIVLSVAIIPLVLFTYVRAWSGDFVGHRRLAKFTFPLWLYVAITGVVVYLMLSPYYK